MMSCDTLTHVTMRRSFKSLLSQTGVLYTRSCINPQIRSQLGLGIMSFRFLQILITAFSSFLSTIIYKHWVTSASRHFRHCYLKANKVSKNVGQANHFWKCIFACTVHTDVLINGVTITHVNHAKFLCVYIDKNLSWDFHRETVEKKISKVCGILDKLKYSLPRSLLLLVYNSLLLPYLIYNMALWYGQIVVLIN